MRPCSLSSYIAWASSQHTTISTVLKLGPYYKVASGSRALKVSGIQSDTPKPGHFTSNRSHQDNSSFQVALQASEPAFLLSLPNELIQEVALWSACDAMGTDDLNTTQPPGRTVSIASFRSTCRTVESATRPLFLHRKLKGRRLVLGRTKLEDFKAVSVVPDIAKVVNTVKVCRTDIKDMVNGPKFNQPVDVRARTRGQWASLIAEALRNFPNVNKIGLGAGRYNLSTSQIVNEGGFRDESKVFEAMVMAAEACGSQLQQMDNVCYVLKPNKPPAPFSAVSVC